MNKVKDGVIVRTKRQILLRLLGIRQSNIVQSKSVDIRKQYVILTKNITLRPSSVL